jgi:hypothetical protein
MCPHFTVESILIFLDNPLLKIENFTFISLYRDIKEAQKGLNVLLQGTVYKHNVLTLLVEEPHYDACREKDQRYF